MDNQARLIAIESIILNFAEDQFTANGILPSEASLIMEAVNGKVQRHCLESVIMGMVERGGPETEKHTGTVEDLKKAMAARQEGK